MLQLFRWEAWFRAGGFDRGDLVHRAAGQGQLVLSAPEAEDLIVGAQPADLPGGVQRIGRGAGAKFFQHIKKARQYQVRMLCQHPLAAGVELVGGDADASTKPGILYPAVGTTSVTSRHGFCLWMIRWQLAQTIAISCTRVSLSGCSSSIGIV